MLKGETTTNRQTYFGDRKVPKLILPKGHQLDVDKNNTSIERRQRGAQNVLLDFELRGLIGTIQAPKILHPDVFSFFRWFQFSCF